MIKRFFIDCVLFQGKEPLHKFIGVFIWLNFIQALLAVIGVYRAIY